MKASDVCRAAGDLLRAKGWCQGTGRGPDGSYCVVAAVAIAAGDETFRDKAMGTLQEAIGWSSSVSWNDYAGRTVEEVLIAVDAAYVVALQEEGVEPEDVLG